MPALSPDQWQAVSPYLDQALTLSEGERADWLERVRQENPVLAGQLRELLNEHRAADEKRFLEKSPDLPEVRQGLEGQIIGAYRLIASVGQGGMGTIWLAERNDGRFERRAAVKFLNISLLGRGGEARFKREGAILGRLAHPNIAELLDAGVTSHGQPYLVLEYIEGESIDQYCNERKLDVRARVRLFLDVLGAVAHAHANLIVHRDIKPSNVLVSKDGQAKLLDFGIAKLLEGEGQDGSATVLTHEAGSALTPEYAAPEQITGKPVTTATDVYALGVLLYVLLSGQHPAGSGPFSPAALVKAIVDTEPTRPSDVATSKAAAAQITEKHATQRTTTPDKLRRLLRGDLDTIVAKALKKDPHARYSSVTAMADDLLRYLNHQPISARPDSIAYRAGKFIRRNRTAVALATLTLLALIGGITGTLIQARTARMQRDFALRQLSRAEAVNDLSEFMFTKSALSGATLDEAARILGQQQGVSLANRVESLISLGRNAGVAHGDARRRRLLEEAYQLSRGLPEPSARAKASCALGEELAGGDQLPRAEGLIQEGLAALPDEPQFALDRVACLLNGGVVSRANAAVSEAISRLQLAQQLLKQSPPHSEMLDLRVSMDLADSLRMAGQNREACTEFEQAAARLTALGRHDVGLGGSVDYKWGLSLSLLGRPREAEKLIHHAIVLFSDSEDDAEVIPWHIINHARVERDLGDLDKAAKQADHGYARAQQTGNQVWADQALLLRASIYRMRGELDRTQEMLTEVEPRLRHNLAPGNISFAVLLSEQALLAQARGNLGGAFDMVNQALVIATASAKAGQGGADVIPGLLVDRSEIERQMGRTDDAVTDATGALGQIQEATQPGILTSKLGAAYLAQGQALQAQGKADQAQTAFRAAVQHLQDALGPDHPDTRKALQLANSLPPHP